MQGIAYIEFATVDSAIAALSLNGQLMLNMPVLVKPSEAEKVRNCAAHVGSKNPFEGEKMLFTTQLVHFFFALYLFFICRIAHGRAQTQRSLQCLIILLAEPTMGAAAGREEPGKDKLHTEKHNKASAYCNVFLMILLTEPAMGAAAGGEEPGKEEPVCGCGCAQPGWPAPA